MKFRKFKEKLKNHIKSYPFDFGFISGWLLGIASCSFFAFQLFVLLYGEYFNFG